MGLLDGIKSLGRGIASIPGKLNEARFTHGTRMVPIGKDPDTGDDIEIPEEDLMSTGYSPATGQVYKQEQVRTGPSGFGNFISKGLPRMIGAGITAGPKEASCP